MSSPASPFPWDDEDDDQPGVSIRPLSHADLDRLLEHDQNDRPALPPRIRRVPVAGTAATTNRPMPGGTGRPGGSAQAEYQRRRTAELAAWTRTLPWRVAATLTAGVGVGFLTARLAGSSTAGLVVAATVAAGAGWALRFRVSRATWAWQRGAHGERKTARLLAQLEPHGWTVLHDLAVPGSRANIDHLAIGPPGVFVIDSKHYRGRLRQAADGSWWHGRYPLAPTLRAVQFEADRAAAVLGAHRVPVLPLVVVHGAAVPWGGWSPTGCPWWPPRSWCQHCVACRRFCRPGGSPTWSTRPGRASTPPPEPPPTQDLDHGATWSTSTPRSTSSSSTSR
jgi:hypothetical protein